MMLKSFKRGNSEEERTCYCCGKPAEPDTKKLAGTIFWVYLCPDCIGFAKVKGLSIWTCPTHGDKELPCEAV